MVHCATIDILCGQILLAAGSERLRSANFAGQK